MTSKAAYDQLSVACEKGDLHRITQLVDSGADVDATPDEWEPRPLFKATLHGQAEAVRLLLECGADPDRADTLGDRPLHNAAAGAELEIVRHLLSAGADVDARDGEGRTPLMAAAHYECQDKESKLQDEVAGILLENGASATAKDNDGSTALHFAAFRGRAELARMLLEAGADPLARDEAGRIPEDDTKANPGRQRNPELREGCERVAEVLRGGAGAPEAERFELASVTDNEIAKMGDREAVAEALAGEAYLSTDSRNRLKRMFSTSVAESEESRDWREFEGLRDLPKMVNEEKSYAEARLLIDANRDEYADYHFLYIWEGLSYECEGDSAAAVAAYERGIEPSREKHALYDRLGAAHFKNGNFEGAVEAWAIGIRSVLDNGLPRAPTQACVHLGYVAGLLGFEALQQQLGRICGGMALTGEGQRELDSSFRRWVEDAGRSEEARVERLLLIRNVIARLAMSVEVPKLRAALGNRGASGGTTPSAPALSSVARREDASPTGQTAKRSEDDPTEKLFLAARHRDVEPVKELLKAGADVNAVHDGKFTALHYAVIGGHQAVVETLLAAGADANQKAYPGFGSWWTPLAYSAEYGREGIVERLLQVGADVNGGTDHGTALALAASRGREGIVERLLQAGARPSTRSCGGGIEGSETIRDAAQSRVKPTGYSGNVARRDTKRDDHDYALDATAGDRARADVAGLNTPAKHPYVFEHRDDPSPDIPQSGFLRVSRLADAKDSSPAEEIPRREKGNWVKRSARSPLVRLGVVGLVLVAAWAVSLLVFQR